MGFWILLVWGFNRTERSGAVYLAAALAAHNQKGLPAFGIYGQDVMDAGDQTIPPDVEEKLLRFAKVGLAAATMRNKSYLSMGGCSMGIAGSIVDRPFFESYLGMRVEEVDMLEFFRRVEEGIYDPKEVESGAIPICITHNDAKINAVRFRRHGAHCAYGGTGAL